MSKFQAGDQVTHLSRSDGRGRVVGSGDEGYVWVNWPNRSGSQHECIEFLAHANSEDGPALGRLPFKRGDRVEHIENNHGFVMTVLADQYTSGAVLTEWPNGTRHTEQAKFLKHAAPANTIRQDLNATVTAFGGDPVSAPDHYRAHPSGIETITITRHESFLRGNILKYCLRAPYKNNELEDMKKAAQYLAWEIERLEGEANE